VNREVCQSSAAGVFVQKGRYAFGLALLCLRYLCRCCKLIKLGTKLNGIETQNSQFYSVHKYVLNMSAQSIQPSATKFSLQLPLLSLSWPRRNTPFITATTLMHSRTPIN